MSCMKAYLEDVSTEMGYNGAPDDRVTAEAGRRLQELNAPLDDNRHSRGKALPIAKSFAARLAAIDGVTRVEIAGSLRRNKSTVRDIDIVCEATNGKAVIAEFIKLDGITKVLCAGKTKANVIVEGGVQIDLRVIVHESFGAAMQHCTGSRLHNIELRQQARQLGWKLNEYGLYNGTRQLAGEREEDIYALLGLAWVPPEQRN